MTTVLKTRIWNNITITEEISTSTGKMTLRNNAGTLLATSDPVDWVIDDLATFTRNYNSLNRNRNKSDQEFTQFFYSDGVPIFNKDRADVLNDKDLYESEEEYKMNLNSLYKKGVPGVKDPNTGLNVNSRGEFSRFNTEGSAPQFNNLRSNETSSFGSNSSYSLSSLGSSARSLPAGNVATLIYPAAKYREDDTDFVQITGHKYTAPDVGALSNYETLIGADRLGNPTTTVVLPMQPSISETSTVDWGGDRLSPIQAMFASAAGGAIDAVASTLSGDMQDAKAEVSQTLGSLARTAEGFAKAEGTIPFVKAYFAGKAIGSNIATRATGQVINPNLELLFNGPNLRQFNFNFTLTPRDSGESKTIKQMIRFFKKSMNPEIVKEKLFLYTPDIFQIEYKFKGGEHPFLNKIKPCALQSFNVNYTGGNSYMTYQDGSMTQYQFTMVFGEIVPIYSNDQDAAGGTGY